MKTPDDEPVIVMMTREQALQLGLLTCECGHPWNNHFDFGPQACAHCGCKGYDEVARRGKLLHGKGGAR